MPRDEKAVGQIRLGIQQKVNPCPIPTVVMCLIGQISEWTDSETRQRSSYPCLHLAKWAVHFTRSSHWLGDLGSPPHIIRESGTSESKFVLFRELLNLFSAAKARKC